MNAYKFLAAALAAIYLCSVLGLNTELLVAAIFFNLTFRQLRE